MTKNWALTEEEFEAIKKAITNVLHLWHYDFIEANDGAMNATSMSKEVFFEQLKGEFSFNPKEEI